VHRRRRHGAVLLLVRRVRVLRLLSVLRLLRLSGVLLLAGLRPRLAGRYAGQTLGVAAAFGPGDIGLVSPVHPAGAVLDELGLARPPQQRIAEPTLTLSAEELPRVDADHLFYFYWGYTGEPTALTGNPL